MNCILNLNLLLSCFKVGSSLFFPYWKREKRTKTINDGEDDGNILNSEIGEEHTGNKMIEFQNK